MTSGRHNAALKRSIANVIPPALGEGEEAEERRREREGEPSGDRLPSLIPNEALWGPHSSIISGRMAAGSGEMKYRGWSSAVIT